MLSDAPIRCCTLDNEGTSLPSMICSGVSIESWKSGCLANPETVAVVPENSGGDKAVGITSEFEVQGAESPFMILNENWRRWVICGVGDKERFDPVMS